ncbi:hypothetical protein SERLA73DRAFT_64528 [Serpula lacrymans var. lacrymans S7.3]|uniref:RNase III domain-containing protein n=1 Tax=Serpula lacrymans var. lacrymans (strain S7.3) TaxID=936435 RepID=F8QEU8_SERL3|nr:hypothetical protein SERLA73DRAFT_64528 [Serpula lacrymans var. lacrymans S7.3]
MNNLPALPKIDGDLMLDVFTHRSLAHNHTDNEDYGNTDRLARLGEDVLRMTITFCLFTKRPMLSASEILEEKEKLLANETFNTWVSTYRLKDKVRCATSTVLDTPEETRFLFHSYVGAVYTSKGMAEVCPWISRLICPEVEPPVLPGGLNQTRPAPGMPQPPLYPTSAILSGSSAPGLPASAGTLAIFNQTANKMGLPVNYPAESSGPSHNPQWIVRCVGM